MYLYMINITKKCYINNNLIKIEIINLDLDIIIGLKCIYRFYGCAILYLQMIERLQYIAEREFSNDSRGENQGVS